MKVFMQNMLTREGYVIATLIVSGLMAAAGLAGNSPFVRIAVVIALYNVLSVYWFNKLWEAQKGEKNENSS